MDVWRRQPALGKPRLPFWLGATWMCGVVFCVGCQTISFPEQVVSTEKPLAAEISEVDPVEVAELEQLLSEGHWEIERQWSVLSLTGQDSLRDPAAAAPLHHRWRFVVPESLTPPPKSRDGLPTPSVPVDPDRQALLQRYDGLWNSTSQSENSKDSPRGNQLSAALRKLSSRSDLVGGNAVVILARQPAAAVDDSELLAAVVQSAAKLPTPEARKRMLDLRCAAAETWCGILSRRAGDPEEQLSSPGRLLQEIALPDEIRGELFRGVAQRIPPRQIPSLNDVIKRGGTKHDSPALLLAALEACVIHAWRQANGGGESSFEADRWPDGLRNCRYADDTAQRKLYARWAVLAHQPDALAVIKSQRIDTDLGVREAAVASLGLLKSPAVHEELQAAMAKGTEPEKVAAISGLARRGREEIERYAHDESPRVRRAIAAELGKRPSRASGLILAEYLRDRSPEVQLAALEACGRSAWSGAERTPLLLQALRVGVLKTRLEALSLLQQDWGSEPLFPVDGTLEERQAAVRELAAAHQVSAEVFTAFSPGGDSQPSGASVERQRTEVQRLLSDYLHAEATSESAQAAGEQLQTLDRSSSAILEQELATLSGPGTEVIYREILPRLNPAYAALASLESRDAGVRRTAARQLKEQAARASLSSTVLRRLQSRLLNEQDHLVWQEVFGAILPDSTPEAAQIALVALNSQWPDVRQLGCDYLERHPQPECALWLLPRLQDADRSVRLKAIQVSGRCGNPVALDGFTESADTVGLRQFLTSADQQLRWEAVVAMSTLGDSQASQELIRQTYDPQARQREQAVRALGKTGQSRFIEPLLKRLWTETDPGVQSTLLEALHQLVPMEDQPGLAPESPISDKINHWARWWEARQRRHRIGAAGPASASGQTQ